MLQFFDFPNSFSTLASIYITLFSIPVGFFVGTLLKRLSLRLPVMMQQELENFLAEENGKDLPHTKPMTFLRPLRSPPELRARIGMFEIITAILFGYTVWTFGLSIKGVAALYFVSTLIALTSIDAKTKLLPDSLTLPLVWVGMIINSIGVFASLDSALYGAVFGYMCLWSLYWIFKLITGKEGMGHGDFKLLAALGAWFGVNTLPTVLLLSAGVGALVGVVAILAAKKGRDYQVPFGPYLAAAGLLMLFFERPVIALVSQALAFISGQ